MRHLVAIARAAGVKRLIAEILAENLPMLRIFEQSGLAISTKREAELRISLLNCLQGKHPLNEAVALPF
jgi:L-amino acid N-acyltransferase YncA